MQTDTTPSPSPSTAPRDLTDGTARLDTVRMYFCGSGYQDYVVDEVIDPVAGFSLDIDDGSYCAVDVKWDTPVFTDKNGSFRLKYDEATTSVSLDANEVGQTDFTPFTVTLGSFTGNDPFLGIVIDHTDVG